jgi:hypothetical protein
MTPIPQPPAGPATALSVWLKKSAALSRTQKHRKTALKADKAGGGRLRWCEPTPDGPEFDCYCAVSAGGYFFLKGEELASLDPLAPAETVDWEAAGRAAYKAGYRSFCSYGGGHWWLEHRQDGSPSEIIDLNIGLNDPNDRFPYVKEGHGQKFQGPGYKRPSRRALELIGLVKETRPGGSHRRA